MWSGWTALGAQRNVYLMEAALLIKASPYMRVTETCGRTDRWEDKRLCIHHTVDSCEERRGWKRAQRSEGMFDAEEGGWKSHKVCFVLIVFNTKKQQRVTQKFSKGETCWICSSCSQGSESSITTVSNSRLARGPLWSLSRGGVVVPALFSRIWRDYECFSPLLFEETLRKKKKSGLLDFFFVWVCLPCKCLTHFIEWITAAVAP